MRMGNGVGRMRPSGVGWSERRRLKVEDGLFGDIEDGSDAESGKHVSVARIVLVAQEEAREHLDGPVRVDAACVLESASFATEDVL